MALFKKSGGGQSVAEIVKLLQANNVTPKPKASLLERLFAPLQGIGSAPDVAYRTWFNREKAPLSGFGMYAGNIFKGLKTALTGERMDKPFKTTSDLLERSGAIAGQDTGSRFARGALGFAGDVAFDPTTYISLGSSALAEQGAKALTKEAAESLTRKAITNAEKKFIKTSLKSGNIDGVAKLLKVKGLEPLITTFKQFTDNPLMRNVEGLFDDKAINNIASTLKTQSYSKSLTPKVMEFVEGSLQNDTIANTIDKLFKLDNGAYAEMAKSLGEAAKNVSNKKTLSFGIGKLKTKPITNKAAVFTAEALTNPLGKVSELVGAGVKKVAPEFYDKSTTAFSKVFNMDKLARAANIGGAKTAMKTLDQELQGLGRVNRAKLGGVITNWQKFTPEEKVRFTTLIDNPEALGGLGKLEGEIVESGDKVLDAAKTWKSFNMELSDELVARKVLETGAPLTELGWKDVKSRITEKIGAREAVKEAQQFTDEQIKRLTEAGIETPEQLIKFLDEVPVSKTGDPFMNAVTNKAPVIDPVHARYDQMAEAMKVSSKDMGKASDEVLPKPEYIRSILKDSPLEMNKRVENLRALISERAKIPPNKQIENYILHDVLGVREEYLKSKLSANSFNEVMADKAVQKDIRTLGYVSSDTFDELLRTKPQVKRGFSSLLQSPQSAMEESLLQREFPAMAQGEAKGIVYNKDMAAVMEKSLGRSEKAVRLARFAEGLPQITDDLGKQLFFTEKGAEDFYLGNIPNSMEKFNIKGVGSFYAPKEAMKILKTYTGQFITDDGADYFLKGFDTIMNKYVKPWFTAKGPGFIAYNMRNAFGDFFNMKIAGFKDVSNIKEGIKVLQFENLAKKEGLEAAKKKFGDTIAGYWDEATKKGVLKASALQTVEESGITERGLTSIDTLLQKGKSVKETIGGGLDYITSAGGLLPGREESFRLGMFIDSYKQTGDWDKAMKSVNDALFDFGDLTPTERNVFKRIIPFYSYMRKNFEFQLTNLAKNPGKYTTINHFIQNVQKNVGEDITDEEWNAMPEWMKSSTAFPIKKKNGELTTLTGFGLPIEAINSAVGKDFGDTMRQLIAQSNPLAKFAVEKATGYDTYASRPIAEQKYGGRYQNMPQLVKDLLQYKETTGYSKDGTPFQRMTVNPQIAHLLNAIPWTSGAMTTAKRVSEVPEDPMNLINLLSGARVYTRNIAQEEEARAREKQQALYDFLLNQGYGTMYQGFTIPKELRGQLVSKYGTKQ